MQMRTQLSTAFMSLLAGKVVCITGSSRGIGRATAVESAKQGAAALILHYFGDGDTTDEIQTIREEIAGLHAGCKILAVPGDIAKQETALQVESFASIKRIVPLELLRLSQEA